MPAPGNSTGVLGGRKKHDEWSETNKNDEDRYFCIYCHTHAGSKISRVKKQMENFFLFFFQIKMLFKISFFVVNSKILLCVQAF